MKKNDRLEMIRKRIRAEPRQWRVDELAGMFDVSPLTVRRDLEELAQRNIVLRTHGGCVPASRAADSPYYRRISANFQLKSNIGKQAARRINPGQTILINDGSTCFHLASNLGECTPLTVYTNSIAMIPELSRTEGVKVCVLGGEYDRNLFYLVGGMMERMLEMVRFDIVFLGADAIDERGRCMSCDADVARVTEMMLRRGTQRILLADHTKLGASGHVAYAALNDFDMWITSPGLPEELRKKFSVLTRITDYGESL